MRHRDDAHQGRRGQHDHAHRPGRRARRDRQTPSRLPARALGRAGIRGQGRRRGRRPRAGGSDGGSQPPLHRRYPRDRRGKQPPGSDDRRLDPARQPAPHRRAADPVAAGGGHQRPRATQDHGGAQRPPERLPARDRVRHHRGFGSDGDRRGGARPARSASTNRPYHGGLLPRSRHTGHRGRSRRSGRDDGTAEGRAQAEPHSDTRGPARAGALRTVREHRPRQQLAGRRPRRDEARRLRRDRVRIRLGHGDGEVLQHRLPRRTADAVGRCARDHRPRDHAPWRASRSRPGRSPGHPRCDRHRHGKRPPPPRDHPDVRRARGRRDQPSSRRQSRGDRAGQAPGARGGRDRRGDQ